jgi:hypothetical protein
MESGGTRNYEVYKDKAKVEEEVAQEKEEEEKDDPMKALENRVLDSQREMADLDNLEEIKAMNRRHVNLLKSAGDGFDADTKALLEAKDARLLKAMEITTEELNENGVTAEEEELVKSIKFGRSSGAAGLVRLNEEDEKREEMKRKKELELIQQRQRELLQKSSAKPAALPKIKIKRKKLLKAAAPSKKKAKVEPPKPAPPAAAKAGGGLAGLLGDYGSDSASD